MEILGFILAALIGVSLSLIGGGGSILTVPILVYIMDVNPILSTSYSLFIVGSCSMVGAVKYYRNGYVSIRTALLFGLSSITTVFITRKIIMPAVPSVLFSIGQIKVTQAIATMVLFAILMLCSGTAMIRSRNEVIKTNKVAVNTDIKLVKLLLFGILIGLVTGFLGAGGGFLLIPVLVLILKLPMKRAIGTSLLIIGLNSLIGFTGDIGHFTFDWKFLITITLIAIGGIFIGGFFAKKIEGYKLKKAFGWFVLVMGIYIIIKELLNFK